MRRAPFRTVFVLLAAAASFAAAQAQTATSFAPRASTPPCVVTPGRIGLHAPLAHVAQQLADRMPVKIVALGSSSTLGYGASAPAAAYPSRRAEDLAARLPGRQITVLNRGFN